MSPRGVAWIERLVWILIYGGLFAVVLGIVTHGESRAAGWLLATLGGIAVAAGVVLIWVRSRLHADAAGGAQSSTSPRDPT